MNNRIASMDATAANLKGGRYEQPRRIHVDATANLKRRRYVNSRGATSMDTTTANLKGGV